MNIYRHKPTLIVKIFSLIGFCLIFSANPAASQANSADPLSAKEYLNILSNSKDSLYNQIIAELDVYLSKFPDDVKVRISRCEIIENAYYDTYNDYNPKDEEFEICLNQLMRDLPDNQEVLLYKLDRVYGDSAIHFSNNIIELNKKNPGSWDDKHLSLFYAKLAQTYRYSDETVLSLDNASIAQQLNDTLDLSVVMANNYFDIGKPELAEKALLNKLDTAQDMWVLKNKANLLLKAGNAEKALDIYKIVMTDSSVWIDEEKIADIFLKNGMPDQAREFYLKNVAGSFNKGIALQRLFQFDYQHSQPDTVLATYNKLMELGVKHDLFGKYRLQMLLKKPFSGWMFSDFLKLLMLILSVAILFILPYFWVLPLYYLSHKYFKIKKALSLKGAEWGLKEFWLVSSAILILQFLYLFVFSYNDLLGIFSDDIYGGEVDAVSASEAAGTIFYFLIMTVAVMVFVINKNQFHINTGDWTLGKCIGNGIGLAVLLRITYSILVKVGLFPSLDFSGEASIVESIRSINEYYHPLIGFLFVAIIVPIYEEYLFRAIALTAIEKRIGFILANIMQAVMFALMHDDLSLFFFYVAFGMIAGHLVRKSESVLPGIIFHSTNNAIAFISILILY